MPGLSLVAVRRGCSSLQCTGFSLCDFPCCGAKALVPGLQQLWPTGFSYPVACGTFSGQGPNLSALHWQENPYPLYHLGSCAFSVQHQKPSLWNKMRTISCYGLHRPSWIKNHGQGLPGGPVAKTAFPMQEAPRSIPGWGTRSHMPQLWPSTAK